MSAGDLGQEAPQVKALLLLEQVFGGAPYKRACDTRD